MDRSRPDDRGQIDEGGTLKTGARAGVGGLGARATTGFGDGFRGASCPSTQPASATNGSTFEDSSSSTSPAWDRGSALSQFKSVGALAPPMTPPQLSQLRSLTPPRAETSSGRTTPRGLQAVSTTSIGASLQASVDVRNLVKRELEISETRCNAQIARMRDVAAAALEKTDRLREAAIQRLDQKISTLEAVQTKVDRKVSEMSGAIRGLSDETQSQIRRMDAADARLWEFRHQMEEEFRQKCAELLEQQQASSSKSRVLLTASDESAKRISQRVKRLEVVVEERLGQRSEEMVRVITDLQGRLELVEEVQHGEASARSLSMDPEANDGQLVAADATEAQDARLYDLQKQILDLQGAVDRLKLEAHGDGGWFSKVEELETRLGGFRQKVDSQDQFYQKFDEKVRHDWDNRLHQMQKSIQDHGTRSHENGERLDELNQWAKAVDQAVEDLCCGQQPLAPATLALQSEASLDVAELNHRVEETEEGILRLAAKIREIAEPTQLVLAALRSKMPADEIVKPAPKRTAASALLRGLKSGAVAKIIDNMEEEPPEARVANGNGMSSKQHKDSPSSVANFGVGDVVGPLSGFPQEHAQEELSELLRRVDDSESECTKLQDSLKGRIEKMDNLLERVATEVLGSPRTGAANGVHESY